MKRSMAPLYLGLLLCWQSPAFAWGGKGHEIVAHIAERHLTASARETINALLPADSTFAEAANWPDRVGRRIAEQNPYHVVSIARGAETYDEQRDCPHKNCIVEAIPWYAHVLGNQHAPGNERLVALRFLAHLVGDIHQPLHASFADNNHGSAVRVVYRQRRINLHDLWDAHLIHFETGPTLEVAKDIDEQLDPAGTRAWQISNSEDWANESFALALSHAYPIPSDGVITPEYIAQSLPIIKRRLALAGRRLAQSLNEILGR